MHTFSVWTPLSRQVELLLGRKRMPMQPRQQGWWSLQVDLNGERAVSENDYAFVLDGEGPFPDPRAPCQPNGVHGLSRLLNHAAFKWTDASFRAPPLPSALVYELHVGTFTPEGTLDAAIGKLEYLAQLGVTHVELMPLNAFPGVHGWGYDGVALFAVHQPYGGPEALKRFVNAAHARGLAVLLDVVYNHLGPSGNYLAKFGPYFTTRYHTPWGPAINWDGPDSDQVRRFFCDNALMWLRDYHLDGLRLDAVHAFLDTSAEPFLEQLSREVRALQAHLGRPLVLIPESDLNDPRLLWPSRCGGFELHAQWSDDFHHALHAVLTGERTGYYQDFGSLAGLAKALRNAWIYDGEYSVFRRRRHGRPHGLDGHHFLGYLQNHDQVGNRAQGDRIGHLVSPERLKIGAALVLTSPFVPMLFMGEEWAASTPFQYFANHQEPDLVRAVSEGRCREFVAFGWKAEQVPDPHAPATFERSRLNWDELKNKPHAEMLEWYRRLIRLRRGEPALSDGRLDLLTTRFDEPARWMVVERGPITLVCNFGDTPQRLPLPGKHLILLSSTQVPELKDGSLFLPGPAVIILKRIARSGPSAPGES